MNERTQQRRCVRGEPRERGARRRRTLPHPRSLSAPRLLGEGSTTRRVAHGAWHGPFRRRRRLRCQRLSASWLPRPCRRLSSSVGPLVRLVASSDTRQRMRHEACVPPSPPVPPPMLSTPSGSHAPIAIRRPRCETAVDASKVSGRCAPRPPGPPPAPQPSCPRRALFGVLINHSHHSHSLSNHVIQSRDPIT